MLSLSYGSDTIRCLASLECVARGGVWVPHPLAVGLDSVWNLQEHKTPTLLDFGGKVGIMSFEEWRTQ